MSKYGKRYKLYSQRHKWQIFVKIGMKVIPMNIISWHASLKINKNKGPFEHGTENGYRSFQGL
jgi:hypothetical protein